MVRKGLILNKSVLLLQYLIISNKIWIITLQNNQILFFCTQVEMVARDITINQTITTISLIPHTSDVFLY